MLLHTTEAYQNMKDGESLISEMPWLVNEIIENKIIGMFRAVQKNCIFEGADYKERIKNRFCEGQGEIIIHFATGLVIGAEIDAGVRSLSFWVENDGHDNGSKRFHSKENSLDHYIFYDSVNNDDPSQKWSNFFNKTITKLILIKCQTPDPLRPSMPNQWGLWFVLEDKSRFVICMNPPLKGKIAFPGVFYDQDIPNGDTEELELPLENLLYLKHPQKPDYF